MISRYFYRNIWVRMILILLLAGLAGWLVFARGYYAAGAAAGIFSGVIAVRLIGYFNTANRKLGYFLTSVRNEDSMLTFSGRHLDKTTQELYEGMAHVNRQIQQLKIESRQQEQYFQTMMEHTATGLMTLSENGFIIHANQSAKRLLGLEVITHIKQLHKVSERLYQAVATLKPFEHKLVSIPSERGAIELSVKTTPFNTPAGELMIIALQDIKKELDEREMDSWLKLIRVLMHEIMNSITPITSLSESLTGYFENEKGRVPREEITDQMLSNTLKGLNIITDQGKGLMSFVESYRKLTRLPKPEKRFIPIHEVFSRLAVLFPSMAGGQSVTLTYETQPADLEVFADEGQLNQVLINLVKNAIHATRRREGGVVHLKAFIDGSSRTNIQVNDNGHGIPSEISQEIFVPFFTTSETGSGIGLSVSKQIMRLHNGTIKVRSVPDVETSFTLIF